MQPQLSSVIERDSMKPKRKQTLPTNIDYR